MNEKSNKSDDWIDWLMQYSYENFKTDRSRIHPET